MSGGWGGGHSVTTKVRCDHVIRCTKVADGGGGCHLVYSVLVRSSVWTIIYQKGDLKSQDIFGYKKVIAISPEDSVYYGLKNLIPILAFLA